jgi:hypothetical protein
MDFKTFFISKLYSRITIPFGLISLMLLSVFPVKNSIAADIKQNASQCSDIVKLAVPGFTVEKAEIVPAGPIPGPGSNGDQIGRASCRERV